MFAALLRQPGSIDNETHYLRRAVRNECYSLLSGRVRRREEPDRPLLETIAPEGVNHAERLTLEGAIRQLPPEQNGAMNMRGAFPWELLPSPVMRPLFTHRLVNTLRAWSELSDIARKPWPERAALAVGPIARLSEGWGPNNPPSGPTTAVMWFQQAMDPDALILDRCSRIAVAIERYRRTHGESLPAALMDLVPNYLTDIPEDPHTGKPLLYRADPDTYLVYSVGRDGKDEGGKLRVQPGPDTGIRVVIRK